MNKNQNGKKQAILFGTLVLVITIAIIITFFFLIKPKNAEKADLDSQKNSENVQNIENVQNNIEETQSKENTQNDIEEAQSQENTQSIEETESVLNTEAIQNTEDKMDIENGVEKKQTISEDQIEWFNTQFFNIDEDHMPNMFLFTEYDSPENIDLSHVFYNGANGRGGGEVTEEERYLVTGSKEWESDISRTTKTQMDEILKKYTGITLEESKKINLNNLIYLKDYDAYYQEIWDTAYRLCKIESGWENEDGTISLMYIDEFNLDGKVYAVTLKQVNEQYYFLKNECVSNSN